MTAGNRMRSGVLSGRGSQNVTQETIGYARDEVGANAVGEIAGAIPGLGRFSV